ncbi:FluG family protein [Penicillium verhagenii]|nr:FluG family protein [Penicillium verhagenii]
MSEDQRLAVSTKEMMPGTLAECLAVLDRNAVLPSIPGNPMLSTYIAVKKGEMKVMKSTTGSEAKGWWNFKF